ncbi:MAG: ABC transporter substrate-binding protein [Phycisphaerae bacterium]|nr:ABC transporter substrate-binding protein [Phycisphaerae bacterium]
MENRFGFKDLVMMALVLAIIVMLGLKMVQDDRHWDSLSAIGTKLDQQTKDITALRRVISQGGVRVGNGAAPSTIGGNDIFRRVHDVRKLPDFAEGDTYISAFSAAPPKLNYLTSHSTYGRVVYCKILEGLAEWDIEKLEMVPHLARSWKWAEDRLSLDVQLRTDVTFSDGEPMTADDLVYTWELKKDPEITDGHDRAYYAPIKSVEKLGEHEVRIHFVKIFYENFMRAMEVPVLPKHFFKKFTKRQIRESPALVMGTGPYRLADPTKYTPGEPVELLRNERYWAVPPPYDRMVYRIIEKESTELVAFRNGELDAFIPTPEQHLQMLKDEPLKSRTQHQVYGHVRTGYYYLDWNEKSKGKDSVYADKRVRQAMTMLLDRQRLCDEIFLGFAEPCDGPFHPMSPQHNPKIKPWAYDPDRGVELLLAAGFKKNAEGRMLKPDGTPFNIDLSYGSGSDLLQKVALFLKDNLARAGISVKLNPLKWAVLLQNMREKNYEASLSGWGGGSVESDIEQMFHTKNIKEGDNRNGYSNPELDRLIEQAHVTLEYDDRLKIWHKCHEILHEDQPYTFMTVSKVRLWLDDRIKNVKRVPVFGLNSVTTWAVPIEWYVPKKLQKRTD